MNETKPLPTWRDTFNTDLRTPLWGHIERARSAARECGYAYMHWNGVVYDVETLETVCDGRDIE